MITPFRSTEEGSPESRFNHVHAKTRNIVERTIGVLKNRFRCILGARQLHYTPTMAAKITVVCAALHNICIHFKMENPEVTVEAEVQDNTHSEIYDDSTALDIRSRIMETFNT